MSVEEIDVVVSFLKVGHGDSVVLRFREGHELRTMVIDGGGPEHSGVLLSHLLTNMITQIDLLVATHIDRCHVAGLIPVAESERLTIEAFWGPGCESAQPSVPGLHTPDERTYQRLYARIAQRVRADRLLCPTRGMPLPKLFRDCTPTVLNPLRQNVLKPAPGEDPKRRAAELAAEQNEHALVLHILVHGLSLLLTSDLEGQGLSSVFADPSVQDYLNVDILKVPHYGRSKAAGVAMARSLRSRAAVFSLAAADAQRVSTDVLSLMQEIRAEVFCTVHGEENAFCGNPNCRAARGGQNVVFFCRKGAATFTPSADACVLALGARP